MIDDPEVTLLQTEVDAHSTENAALRDGGFRRSKAEALLALEYDRIPNVLKTPRSVAVQRKVATAVMLIVPFLVLMIAIIGGIDAYRDHQRSAELRQLDSALDRDFQHKPGAR